MNRKFKEQNINVTNVLTVGFDQFDASLMIKVFIYLKNWQKNFWMVVYKVSNIYIFLANKLYYVIFGLLWAVTYIW